MSFLGMLAAVFIGLKLAGIITWSWFWVLAPLTIPCGIMTIPWEIIIVLIIVALMVEP